MSKLKLSVIAIIVLFVIILALLVALISGSSEVSDMNFQLEDYRLSLKSVTDKFDILQTQYDELQINFNNENEKSINLSQMNSELNETITGLYQANAELKTQNEELVKSMEVLQNQFDELTNNNKLLAGEIESLKADNIIEPQNQITPTEKTASNNNVTVSEPKPQTVTPPAVTTPTPSPATGIVYWVQSGKVWHTTMSCSSLSRSKNILSGTIAESGKERGCNICS